MDSTQDENQVPSELPEEVAKPEDAEAQQPAATPETAEPEAPPQRPRAEEALAAMRRDLRDEESKEQAGARGLKGLMMRIFRRRRARPPAITEEPSRLDELQFPEPPASRLAPPSGPAPEQPVTPPEPQAPAAVEEAKPDFQAMVRNRLGGAFAETVQREPLEMEPPAPVEEAEAQPSGPAHSILTTLRKEEEEPAPLEPVDFRQAALEDYVVATEEPEEDRGPALTRRLRQSWRYMRPLEKRLLISALVIVGLALVGGAGYGAVMSIPTPTVIPTPTPSEVPTPISVSLPGGWVFPLNIGYVGSDGKWNPAGPEWLSTTELCRWVSIPWNEQREAVVRTFKANDEIQLSMSNYDSIVYKVQSIEQVPSSSIHTLCPDGAALLLILSKDGTDERWVVMAKP